MLLVIYRINVRVPVNSREVPLRVRLRWGERRTLHINDTVVALAVQRWGLPAAPPLVPNLNVQQRSRYVFQHHGATQLPTCCPHSAQGKRRDRQTASSPLICTLKSMCYVLLALSSPSLTSASFASCSAPSSAPCSTLSSAPSSAAVGAASAVFSDSV
jgi:hypothetical protein